MLSRQEDQHPLQKGRKFSIHIRSAFIHVFTFYSSLFGGVFALRIVLLSTIASTGFSLLTKVKFVHIIKCIQESPDAAASCKHEGDSEHIDDHSIKVVEHIPHHFFLHLNVVGIVDTRLVSVLVQVSGRLHINIAGEKNTSLSRLISIDRRV